MENLIDDNSDKYKGKYRIPSTRLQMWDYSRDGWYFVTICVNDHQCFFGKIEDAKMVLNNVGKLVEKYWLEIPNHFNNVKLDYFVVMPNHLHGIVIINQPTTDDNNNVYPKPCVVVETHGRASLHKTSSGNKTFYRPSKSLSSFVAGFKSITTKRINLITNTPGNPLWQPRFHDHIIKNETELNNIRKYIDENPLRWDIDRNNLDNRDGWINKIKSNPHQINNREIRHAL